MFHANLKAGNWQKANEGEHPNGRECEEQTHWLEEGSEFSVGINAYPVPIIPAHPWGGVEAFSWDLRAGSDPSSAFWLHRPHPRPHFQNPGPWQGVRISFSPFLKLQFIEHLLCARHYTKYILISIFHNSERPSVLKVQTVTDQYYFIKYSKKDIRKNEI